MGGALTIASAANIPEIDASAPFYGVPDLSTLNLKNIRGPMQAYFGELDALKGFSSPEDGERLRKAATEAGVKFELKYLASPLRKRSPSILAIAHPSSLITRC